MPTLETLTEKSEPVAALTPASQLLARFEREPDTMAIAVVENGRPVGLVERGAFLLKLAGPLGRVLYNDRPVNCVMDPEPAVIEAGVRIDTVGDMFLNQGAAALTRAFIVTRNGLYQGVGTAVGLMQALHEQTRADVAQHTGRSRAATDSRAALSIAQEKSRFLAAVARELRAPMNGMVAVSELLGRQPLNTTAQAQVQTLADSSAALISALQDALDLARAEAGELRLNPTPTRLHALMDDIQAHWSPRAVQDGVTLLMSYEGDTELAARIDAGRARQVFSTLIGNALKFARDGVVEASLRAWADGDQVRIEARVRDDGPGMDAERLERMFEPFAEDGGDLGLAVCRRIVGEMGGRLWAENNAGRGSTLAFDISAARAIIQADPESNVSDLSGLSLPSRAHVLIVDDNATNRVVAQALCEMFGCTSELAEDGQEALEVIQARPFDLVLMDIKMPRLDGVQATRAIRALDGPVAQTPIVALTANADPEDAKRYIANGMAAVVEKPIKPERLRMAMNAALGLSAADEGKTGPARSRTAAKRRSDREADAAPAA